MIEDELVKYKFNEESYKFIRMFYIKVVASIIYVYLEPIFSHIPKLRWDNNMKISGEHIDFFVNNKWHNLTDVFFSPNFNVLHVHRTNVSMLSFEIEDMDTLFKNKLKHNQYNNNLKWFIMFKL